MRIIGQNLLVHNVVYLINIIRLDLFVDSFAHENSPVARDALRGPRTVPIPDMLSAMYH